MAGFPHFLGEIRRRKLFRVAAAYAIVAWLLIEVASIILPTFDAPHWVLQVFTFLLILGLPMALALAWAVEITPDGIKRDTNGELSTREQDEERVPAVPHHKSIAVLPFVNMSEDPSNAYFSDGITEEITSKLARLDQLRVAARTSARRFKGAEMDIRDIASQLGVRYVLEGSVRKAGDHVRTTVQLIDSNDGLHLWAAEFDGTLDDIFGFQEEAAVRTAEALDLRISPQDRQVLQHRYTENSQAYDSYLEGQALVQYTDNPEKLAAARRHFERALMLDPDYSAALAGLASVEVHLYRNFEPSETHLEKARDLASKALSNGPSLARAHVAVGEVLAIEYQYEKAAEKFRDALRIQSDDPWTWDSLSWVLGYQQPPDAKGAEKAAREAIRMQPQFSVAYYHLGRALVLQERYDEALATFEHVRELSRDTEFAHFGFAQVYLERGEIERALKEHRAARLLGAPARIQLVSILSELGEIDKALHELQATFEAGFRDFASLNTNRHLSAIKGDPRFSDLLGRYRSQ